MGSMEEGVNIKKMGVIVILFFLLGLLSIGKKYRIKEDEVISEVIVETADYNGDGASPMLVSWTDKEGHIVWKAMTEEEYLNATQEEKAAFDEWYTQYRQEMIDSHTIELDYGETPVKQFSNLCVEYEDNIPYLKGGRSYLEGFVNPAEFFDGIPCDTRELGMGLDDVGFLIWIYRQVFGFTPAGLSEPAKLYSSSKKVEVEELIVGDICMKNSADATENQFGVVAGFVEGKPVIADCTALPTHSFLNGGVSLRFLKSVTEEAYHGNEPADYNYFFRLELEWGM